MARAVYRQRAEMSATIGFDEAGAMEVIYTAALLHDQWHLIARSLDHPAEA
jgi:predicted HD phosphohydrolase